MFEIEMISIGIAFFGFIVEIIYKHFTSKDFRNRIEKFQKNIDNETFEEAQKMLKDVNVDISNRNDVERIVNISTELAKRLESSKQPIRDYFEAVRFSTWFYVCIGLTIASSLASISNPSGMIGKLTYGDLGFLLMALSLLLLFGIILTLHSLNEKILKSELGS